MQESPPEDGEKVQAFLPDNFETKVIVLWDMQHRSGAC